VGGVLISQDGHLPLVIQVFDDDAFWSREVGCDKPVIPGLGRQRLIRIVKETPCRAVAARS
jgi:O-methyltransferase